MAIWLSSSDSSRFGSSTVVTPWDTAYRFPSTCGPRRGSPSRCRWRRPGCSRGPSLEQRRPARRRGREAFGDGDDLVPAAPAAGRRRPGAATAWPAGRPTARQAAGKPDAAVMAPSTAPPIAADTDGVHHGTGGTTNRAISLRGSPAISASTPATRWSRGCRPPSRSYRLRSRARPARPSIRGKPFRSAAPRGAGRRFNS